MKIIVVGAGKVGYSLAERLAQDEHDVIVVEKSAERIRNLENNLDVSIVEGNGTNLELLKEIGLEDVGMLIAVTDSDEVNMLACSVGKIGGVPKTIARIRDREYVKEENLALQKALGVDLFINPEMVTAQELLQIIQTPAALDIEDFANGMVRLIEIKVRDNSQLVGQALKNITFPTGVLAVGILRGGEMIIPHGDSTISLLDNIFFLGAREGITELEEWFTETKMKTENILIVGAGLIGQNLTVLLEKAGYSVKVIEKDMSRCEKLAAIVNDSMIICGDGTNVDLLEAEEIGNNDIIICLTDDDKLNLLVALLGRHFGVSKTFVRVGRPEYITLMEQVGIDVVFSPRLLTSGEILRQVRKGDLVTISTFEGSKAEAIELVISHDSPLAGKALRDVKLPGKALVGAVVRGEETIVPTGETYLYEADHVVLFTLPEYVNKLLAYVTKV